MKRHLEWATAALFLIGSCGGVPRPGATPADPVVQITAQRFEFSPAVIHLKKGVRVELELVSLDRAHGFDAPDLGLHAAIEPDRPSHLSFVPDREGRFLFHCDVFCGSGHEDMTGEILVDP